MEEKRISYTEAEAAELLRMKSERALRELRYERFTLGVHYARLGRTIHYTPEHLENILKLDAPKSKAA